KKDKHLYDWMSHQRVSEQRWRDNHYRTQIANLRKRYSVFGLEDANWKAIMQAPKPEDESSCGAAREHQRTASVGRFIQLAGERAGAVVKVPAPRTTMTCSHCGELTGEIDRASIVHSCCHCGQTF